MMNRRVLLAARPAGVPRLTDFAFSEEPLPDPAAGEFLIAARYLSADPLQRLRLNPRVRGATIHNAGRVALESHAEALARHIVTFLTETI